MPLTLVQEDISVESRAYCFSNQLLVEGDIIVPDSQPDIGNILRVWGAVSISSFTPGTDVVNVTGELRIAVLYQGKDVTTPLYSIQSAIPFEESISTPGVTEDMVINLTANLEHLAYKKTNDRRINVRGVVMTEVEAYEKRNVRVLKEIDDEDIQQKKATIKYTSMAADITEDIVIRETVEVPAGMPAILERLQCDVAVADTNVTAMDGRIGITGNVIFTTIYMADNEAGSIETFETEIPFSGYIEAPNVTEDMIATADMRISDLNVRVQPDINGENRLLNVDVTLSTNTRVMSQDEAEVVQDAYSLKKPVSLQTETFALPQFVGRNKTENTFRETITLDANYPDMMQVLKVWSNIKLDDTAISENNVTAEGEMTTEILYVGNSDQTPVSMFSYKSPFTQDIEVMGAAEGMQAKLNANVARTAFNMLSAREVEVLSDAVFDVYVMDNEEQTVLTQILFDENAPEVLTTPLSSIIVYVIQRGDTLWNIAKAYGTTVGDILSVNNIENPDLIYPGDRLLIIRRV